MALPQEKYQILSEPLHSLALQCSLKNLHCELAGQSTDDPECIDGKRLSLPLLYCLHIERHENQPDDFNIHHLRGWRYGDIIIALAKKVRCALYKAWQHLMQTRFDVLGAENRIAMEMASLASRSNLEFVDLTTPESRRDEGLSSTSSPPIIDLVTPEPVPVVDLSTPEPDQLVAALSVSARALAMSQDRPPGLQLLTPELHRYLLSRHPHPKPNLITVGMAYHYISDPERPDRQKWYYVGQKLQLKAVMAGFASFLGLRVESLYFWLYGHSIKPDETVSNLGIEEGNIIEVESR